MRIPLLYSKNRLIPFLAIRSTLKGFLQIKEILFTTKYAMFFICCFGIFSLTTQCAFSNPRNRPVTSYLDEVVLEPKASSTKKVLLAPLAIPIGFVTVTSDVLLIHPISSLYPASMDAYKYLWEDPSGGILFQTFLFVPKIILTPPFILIDTVVRSLFDVGR